MSVNDGTPLGESSVLSNSFNTGLLASRLYSDNRINSTLAAKNTTGTALKPKILRVSASAPSLKTTKSKNFTLGTSSTNQTLVKSLALTNSSNRRNPNKVNELDEKLMSSSLSQVSMHSDDLITQTTPKTFLESLHLSAKEMDELMNIPNTFYYLNPQRRSDTKFYDLELIPQERIDANHYYTISKEGVTQYRMKQSHFTTLVQWEREFKLFHKISRIKFFRQYRCWKVKCHLLFACILLSFVSLCSQSFTTWKRGLRLGKVGGISAYHRLSYVIALTAYGFVSSFAPAPSA